AGPLGAVALAPSPAVLWWLAGDRSPDPDLPAGAEHAGPFGPGYRASEEGAQAGTEEVVRAVPAVSSAPAVPTHRDEVGLFLVPGKDKLRRRQAAAEKLGSLLASPLPGSMAGWDALIRHATFEESAVLIELDGPLPPEARQRILQASHLSWALASTEELPLDVLPDVPWQELAVAGPQATGAEWQAVTSSLRDGEEPAGGPGSSETGPSQNLSAEQLELVRLAAPGVGGVHAAVRRLAAGHISELAPRIRPSRTWPDLVLDADRSQRLREVVARCRHKRTVYDNWGFSPLPSGGVVALFSGPSGTGKTLAAEIIAGELSLDLYKIDLAALVSKWVGETEKNLAQVFAAAEASNVALFFDEADAIFGKRSEVSDAHDRYANIEVAYLLQRLERYEGLVVLASNLATNIDPAFLRRVHVRVDFPMPEEPERKRIWEQSLPSTAPRADLDIGLLANQFKLSGGSIHNAALTAGFIAADAGSPITMACVVEAVQRELRKLGRLVTPGDFGPYAHLMDGRAAAGSDAIGPGPA
ncbi:MAG TPA: ATP-binding protein, partial [Acidimicrobiales bacterium]|nr:ATP-binding protein [Acidimicrobiales bacterium]